MSNIDDIIAQVPIGPLASKLGVDEATTLAALDSAVPALVSGLKANSQSDDGATSLQRALAQHADDNPVDLESVDEADGQKIVRHIFGGEKDAVVNRLGAQSGPVDSSLFAKLLPLLAPIVMQQISQRIGAAPSKQGGSASGGLADVLGSVLGASSGKGGGIGDLLGGLLGGGRR